MPPLQVGSEIRYYLYAAVASRRPKRKVPFFREREREGEKEREETMYRQKYMTNMCFLNRYPVRV